MTDDTATHIFFRGTRPYSKPEGQPPKELTRPACRSAWAAPPPGATGLSPRQLVRCGPGRRSAVVSERRIAESGAPARLRRRGDPLICACVLGRCRQSAGFVIRFICVEVLPSARRHGVEDADIDHAVRHATVVDEVGEDPLRYLLVGPDRSGNLLELIVLDRPQGPAVIHAMSLRAKYRRLLPPGERP